MHLKSAAVALATIALFAAGAARAEIIHFAATLTGGDEVPANTSTGKGHFSGELETVEKSFVYRADYTGLSGSATMAHVHGPAAPGANGPPVIVMASPVTPISGAQLLTDAQIADLLAGKWYFNVHTKDHPGGEIRGQITRQN